MKEPIFMADDHNDSDFVPPPFSFALMGHLATGVVKAAAIALLLWALTLAGLIATFPVGRAIITAALVMVAVEGATTAVERLFVLRHQHPDPGSIPMTVIVAVLPLPISFLAGLVTGSNAADAVTVMAVTAVVYWTFLVTLDRPWVEGDSAADIRRKFEQTKAMTREHLRSE